mgnify:FL=1
MDEETSFHDRMIQGLSEIKGTMRDLCDQVRRQNGRVGTLEVADRAREIREAEARGAAGTVLTKKQVATIGGFLAGVMGLMEVAIRLLAER